jgi:hypothetical protein
MEKFTCEFILASDLFRGLNDLFGELSDSGRVTWGDSHRTLVTTQRVLDDLYDTEDKDSYEILKSRIGNELDLFVDLEN